MPSPIAEEAEKEASPLEAEKEASPLFTQGRLRTDRQEDKLWACLYQVRLGSWEKLIKKGSVPPLLPADRSRPPMTSDGCSSPKEKMPNGRDGRREKGGGESRS